jgi:hypothetical protein
MRVSDCYDNVFIMFPLGLYKQFSVMWQGCLRKVFMSNVLESDIIQNNETVLMIVSISVSDCHHNISIMFYLLP